MTVLILAITGVALWCLAPIPVAVVVGRAFRAGETEDAFVGLARDYDTAGA
ncbi:hypothetical protein [Nocardioides conyzicola]|uniref:Uncharacterized protein n=1 Tax=Nocardioides conyzicola TaxID=1651781 RepID=A0ABP8XIY6_9ACTN